ncbi:alpha/beta hydrolase [Roseovarius sp. MBR-6]|jgi:pimeloyl-ACP methyl ester carboxylesterase|uniref:alpha/beta fold hydrolase n=1 Tax=Roseovarius sp. MBR-6 TaxID=3156459 RepID=UPI0033997F1A
MPNGLRGGFATHWQVMGQGPRAALAIHCSLAHSGAWAGVARALGADLTLTAFDLPGHGGSGAWENEGEIQATSTAMAADLLDAPADIIGHSFGATVALRLAVEHPGLVRSLSLYEPVFFAVALADRPEMRAGHETEMAAYRAGHEAGDLAGAARGFLRVWGDGEGWDALPAPTRARIAAQMPLIEAAAPALYGDAGGMLASGALTRIAAPVLLMQGARSPAIIGAINDGLAARLPDCRRATIAGAGHMGPITRPQAVAAEIAAFLGIPARARVKDQSFERR